MQLSVKNIDKILIDTVKTESKRLKMDLPLVVATGGYGRGDLAPCSDIDLLFVSKALAKKWAERVVAACWDRKLKISYSIRSLDECAEDMPQDLNFMTSLLDRRFICGPKAVYRRLDGLVKSNIAAIGPGRFVAEKLAERDRRHARAGDTRFILQPNVKEGKGGIRDIHTLFWIDLWPE